MLTEWKEKFEVYRYDGDCFGCLKPAALLRYAQQVAMRHAYLVGLTDEVYAATHTAYVLAKLAVHFERVPRVDEKLTLLTQPEAVRHAVNKRLTRVYDAAGAQAAFIDSRWVLIDTERRVILRKHPPAYEALAWPAEVPGELPMKMHKPPLADCERVGEYGADYSRCDMNGHLNNTRYVDIVFDALPWPVLENSAVRDLLVFYHKEVPRGERFTLYRMQQADGGWYFNGQAGGHCCFEAEVTLAPRGDGTPQAAESAV